MEPKNDRWSYIGRLCIHHFCRENVVIGLILPRELWCFVDDYFACVVNRQWLVFCG